MTYPCMVVRNKSVWVVSDEILWWIRFGSINETLEIITYKKCLELQLLGQIIGAGELERSLCRDIDGHQLGQAAVKVAGVVGISHDEKDDGKKIKDALIPCQRTISTQKFKLLCEVTEYNLYYSLIITNNMV